MPDVMEIRLITFIMAYSKKRCQSSTALKSKSKKDASNHNNNNEDSNKDGQDIIIMEGVWEAGARPESILVKLMEQQ